ncbi:iron complex transport system ATP-binding protein [Corynebacterium freneyi]|uniref:Iron complex transport system ATP-binding protein n=1 Tax=Corynebacterium freneyi TaxID=134034 RepID=A0ABS4UAX1_9CORY|nr:iron complex transport system ATP-binding protein [Corynebacterium freneyi]WJZ04200.1 Iron(3+)-hydroxamate import ATP-binding protein FhuC [Corynebacterium freneyi]
MNVGKHEPENIPAPADGTDGAVRCRNVRVRYDGADRDAVAGVSLSVPAGGWLTLAGPNGCGKSTLLLALAQVIAPESGTISVAGHDIIGGSGALHTLRSFSPGAARRRRKLARTVALMPQVPVIPEGMTVREYVQLGRHPHVGAFSADDYGVTDASLDTLGLGGFADRAVAELSGGERQRVTLARALAQEPSVLLLDEPTSALDIGHAQDVLELVEEVRALHGLTVIAAMHDLTLAGQHGDRIALLDDGSLSCIGAPADILTAERIAEVYGANVEILQRPDGPVVAPVRDRRRAAR